MMRAVPRGWHASRPMSVALAAIGCISAIGAAYAQQGGDDEDGTFPGQGAEVQLEPGILVLGQTTSLAVTGSGFEDCPGGYVLTVRMMDDWRRSRPGQVLGTANVTVGADGQLAGSVPLDVTFDGEWNGGLTMEGGCLEGTGARFAFGPLALGVPTTTQGLAAAGIPKPHGSESAGAFVLGSWFVDRTFVPPDKPGETKASIFHHLSAWVGGTLCDSADVAGGEVTSNGDVVVWVGLPGQPAPCMDPNAVVTFRTGQQDTQLLDQLPVQPGLAVGFRPTYPAPSSGDSATPGAPSAGSSQRVADEQRTPGFAWGAVAIGGAVATATILLIATRRGQPRA